MDRSSIRCRCGWSAEVTGLPQSAIDALYDAHHDAANPALDGHRGVDDY